MPIEESVWATPITARTARIFRGMCKVNKFQFKQRIRHIQSVRETHAATTKREIAVICVGINFYAGKSSNEIISRGLLFVPTPMRAVFRAFSISIISLFGRFGYRVATPFSGVVEWAGSSSARSMLYVLSVAHHFVRTLNTMPISFGVRALFRCNAHRTFGR